MSELFSLKGRIALITGSAQGLGFTIAKGMQEAGADIILSDVSQNALEKSRESLRASGHDAAGSYVFDI